MLVYGSQIGAFMCDTIKLLETPKALDTKVVKTGQEKTWVW
jgi:hypothetical protein